jgi:tight adherence protein B
MATLSVDIWILISTLAVFGCAAFGLIELGLLWDRISARMMSDLTPKLEDLRLDTRLLPYYLRVWGTALVVTALLFTVVFRMLPVAVAAVYLVYVAPRFIIEYLIARRRRLLRDQMVGVSIGLANAVKAGLALPMGLEAITADVQEPLLTELRRITFEWKRGRPLAEALLQVKERLKLDSFTLFAVAITACLERGGKITDALERISYSLTENQRLERKLDADTASGRKVVIILGAFPFIFLAGFMAMDPEHTSLVFTSLVGQIVLFIVLAIVYFSVRWCVKILSIPF